MATIDLGKIKMVWRGAYNNATAYTIDDAVSLSGTSYICIAATTGNTPPNATYWNVLAQGGTDLGATLSNNQIAIKNNSGNIAGVNIGSAGQVLKVNAGNALEFGSDEGGQIVKITTFQNSTRIVLSSAPTGTIFDNMAITKVKDANTSKIIVIGMIPGEYYSSYHCGIYFVCKTTGMDNSGTNDSSAFRGIGQSYGGDSDSPGMMHVNKTFEDTTYLGTGTHNFKIGWRDRAGGNERPAQVINHNSNEDGRAQQAGTFIQFMEVLI
tara:strand:+ start:1642 stop:2442 length:801 start_codon:yes stop_codon:yes gene_type:complete